MKKVLDVPSIARTSPEYPSYFDGASNGNSPLEMLRCAAYEGFGVTKSLHPKYPRVTALQHDWCWITKCAYRNQWATVLAVHPPTSTIIYWHPRGGENWTTNNGTKVAFESVKQMLAREPIAVVVLGFPRVLRQPRVGT